MIESDSITPFELEDIMAHEMNGSSLSTVGNT